MKMSCLALLALLWVPLVPSVAMGSQRMTVVVDEFVEDTQKGRATAFADALISAFTQDPGLSVVDGPQAAKLRDAGRGKLLKTDYGPFLTGMETDYLVVGEVRFRKKPNNYLKNLTVYEASVSIRVVSAATGRIPGTVTENVVGRGVGGSNGDKMHLSALQDAAKNLVKKVAPRVIELLQKPRLLEMRVALGRRLGAGAANDALACVKRVQGIEGAEIQARSKKEMLIELKSALASRDIALAIEEAGCPFAVEAHSNDEVRVAYKRGASVSLTAARFKARGRPAKQRFGWLANELPVLIGTSLSGLDFVASTGDRLVSAKQARARKRGKVALTGSYSVTGNTVNISVDATATWRRRKLVAKAKTCRVKDLGPCLSALSEQMATELAQAVEDNRNAIPMGGSGPTVTRPLAMAIRGVQSIFPAQATRYEKFGIAEVVLRNRTDAPIRDLTLSAEVAGLSKGAVESREGITIAPGAEKTVKLEVQLDEEVLQKSDKAKAAILEVTASFEVDKFQYPARTKRVPVVLQKVNAMSWSKPEAIAAFVSRDSVKPQVDQIKRAFKDDKLRMAEALFEFIKDQGLRYRRDRPDTWSPDKIDDVSFPTQTLRSKGGDCEDLAVLYASLLEEAGIGSGLIVTANHVLVGIDPESLADAKSALLLYATPTVVKGRSWLTVETTQLNKSFEVAMRTGHKRLKRGERVDSVIVPKQAWNNYPAATLAGVTTPLALQVDVQRLTQKMDRSERLRKERLKARIAYLKGKNSARSLNKLGVIYAKLHDLKTATEFFRQSNARKSTASALNNLGNLELIRSKYADAFLQYGKALEKKNLDQDRRLRVLFNGILAGFLASREGQFKPMSELLGMIREAKKLDKVRLKSFLSPLRDPAGTKADGGLAWIASGVLEMIDGERVQPRKDGPKAAPSEPGSLLRLVYWIE